MLKEIETTEDFNKELKDAGNKLVVVDFFAEWCGPCKMIGPKVKAWSENEYKDCVFIKVDVDEASDIAEEYKVSAMPTFVFFKGEKQIETVVGASVDKVREAIEKLK